ncbi:hypothetical protein NUKP41_45500 [Klebsiella variicola]|nr:hypothetical protein NUKP41_45500 [Klebsiella variicola]GKL53651.1 hypothetical protein NUKP61_21270 [Klebsiella variicola]GKO77302.1 hypothetical protein NUBL21983_17950 [Klebsiella variicola]
MCFHAILFKQLDCTPGRQMASGFVGGAQLQRGDQLAVIFQVRAGHHPRATMIPPVGRTGAECAVERAINRGGRNTVQLSDSGDLNGPFGTFGRKTIKPLSQLQQGV